MEHRGCVVIEYCDLSNQGRSRCVYMGGGVDVEITTGDASSGDQLRNLRRWLLDEPEFRGQVALREASPRAGEMGPGRPSTRWCCR